MVKQKGQGVVNGLGLNQMIIIQNQDQAAFTQVSHHIIN